MPPSSIPEHVRRLIVEAIDSVPELEALLLLRTQSEHAWSAEEAGARLYVSVTMARHVLATLAGRGFLEKVGERYRYAPAPELARAVTDLADEYSVRLIAVTQLIHGKPAASVRQFADAFRIRKGD